MNLDDVSKPTLQEALGLDWVFDLHEVLNTRFEATDWKRVGRSDVGMAKLGDEVFRIVLEPASYSIEGHAYKFINVAFQKIVNGQPTEEFQATGKNASKIVGAITNGILDRVPLYDYDALIFIASDNVESRMAIYNKIADRRWVQKGLGEKLENVDLGNGSKATVMMSKELARHRQAEVIEYLKKLSK